jgi:hypothetical protein
MFGLPSPLDLAPMAWDGTLRHLATLWTLERNGRRLTCRLVSCPRGLEVWLLDGDRVVRAEVCSDEEGVSDLAAAWRRG